MLGDKLNKKGFYTSAIAAIAIVLIASTAYVSLNMNSTNENDFGSMDSAYSVAVKWQNVRDMMDKALVKVLHDGSNYNSCTAGQLTTQNITAEYDSILGAAFKNCGYSNLNTTSNSVDVTISCSNSRYNISKSVHFEKTISQNAIAQPNDPCTFKITDISGYEEFNG
jgi:hypothetical protein